MVLTIFRKCKVNKGFVLIDVLTALFLLSLGFAVLIGMNEAVVYETNQAINIHQAANIAQNRIEELAANPWQENFAEGRCIPGGQINGLEGKFAWVVNADWVSPPGLIRVSVMVVWQEQRKDRSYMIESFYDTGP